MSVAECQACDLFHGRRWIPHGEACAVSTLQLKENPPYAGFIARTIGFGHSRVQWTSFADQPDGRVESIGDYLAKCVGCLSIIKKVTLEEESICTLHTVRVTRASLAQGVVKNPRTTLQPNKCSEILH